MNLMLLPTTLNESNALSIHKIIEDEVFLQPGEKREISMLLFPRRTGLQTLKGFRIIDREVKNDKDHESKGYSFSYPKFSIEDK